MTAPARRDRWRRYGAFAVSLAERARLLEMIATRAERKTAHITGESITGYFRERLAGRAASLSDDAIATLARESARGELINTAEAAVSAIRRVGAARA